MFPNAEGHPHITILVAGFTGYGRTLLVCTRGKMYHHTIQQIRFPLAKKDTCKCVLHDDHLKRF